VVIYHNKGAVITVCNPYTKVTDGGGEYRVSTAANGTFVVKDTHAVTQWRTNSADVFAQLHTGKTYAVTYVGFRFSLFSSFHNITSVKRVQTNELELVRCND
jgi:hypothetical protein